MQESCPAVCCRTQTQALIGRPPRRFCFGTWEPLPLSGVGRTWTRFLAHFPGVRVFFFWLAIQVGGV